MPLPREGKKDLLLRVCMARGRALQWCATAMRLAILLMSISLAVVPLALNERRRNRRHQCRRRTSEPPSARCTAFSLRTSFRRGRRALSGAREEPFLRIQRAAGACTKSWRRREAWQFQRAGSTCAPTTPECQQPSLPSRQNLDSGYASTTWASRHGREGGAQSIVFGLRARNGVNAVEPVPRSGTRDRSR